MRTMYDGITPWNLPAGGDLYAGYVDGHWPDAATIAARFPGKPVVRIATSPSTDDGVVGDGPPDNGTWAEWVQWTVRRRAAVPPVDPTMYTNASSWSAGIQAFKDAGVPQPHWWIAHYDGDPTIPAGAVAKQYASKSAYDTSSVADYWPGVDPEPTPAAAAAHLEEDEMSTTSMAGRAGLSWAAGTRHVVQVTYDPAKGDPKLRVVLTLTTGPVVLSLSPAKGSGNLEIPAQHIPTCRGVVFELAPGSPDVVYDACAV